MALRVGAGRFCMYVSCKGVERMLMIVEADIDVCVLKNPALDWTVLVPERSWPLSDWQRYPQGPCFHLCCSSVAKAPSKM
jgi:hypothetical protein